MILTYEEAVFKYGEIVRNKWIEERKYCSLVQVPREISNQWINSFTGAHVFNIYMNTDIASPFLLALQNILKRGFLGELKTFDGCYSVRNVRGYTNQPSAHSYALAIDINAKTNRLGETPGNSPGLVSCFTDAGFLWGGTFKRMDGMHFTRGW